MNNTQWQPGKGGGGSVRAERDKKDNLLHSILKHLRKDLKDMFTMSCKDIIEKFCYLVNIYQTQILQYE